MKVRQKGTGIYGVKAAKSVICGDRGGVELIDSFVKVGK